MSTVRKSVLPEPGDDWASIASRELSGSSTEEAVANLQSWNLHVFMRAPAAADSPQAGNPILPSDVIFVEPPAAPAA
ncbi:MULTISPECIES: hypothetical protein [Pacificimonas]|uniref:hypothetical protein n=1 Tax=Pacificimonas TaxID=1960290 RepID=UPI001CCEAD10|nr:MULTISPECIES: hypothetical protein [Pacificimonas]